MVHRLRSFVAAIQYYLFLISPMTNLLLLHPAQSPQSHLPPHHHTTVAIVFCAKVHLYCTSHPEYFALVDHHWASPLGTTNHRPLCQFRFILNLNWWENQWIILFPRKALSKSSFVSRACDDQLKSSNNVLIMCSEYNLSSCSLYQIEGRDMNSIAIFLCSWTIIWIHVLPVRCPRIMTWAFCCTLAISEEIPHCIFRERASECSFSRSAAV